MSLQVEGVKESNSAQQNSYKERETVNSSQGPETDRVSDEGRDSKIGEQNFNAAMTRDRVSRTETTDAAAAQASLTSPAQGADKPRTFTADDKVPRHVFPGSGKVGPDATPEEAANFIRSLEFGPTGDYRTAQAQFFTQALEDHKGKPEWTQAFLRALGSEKTAELIENSVTPGAHQYSSKKQFEESVGVVRNALRELAENPQLFTQADMNKLVSQMAKGSFNPWVASEIFGKMSYRGENVKNMFFRAAVNTSLNPKTNGRVANEIAAAASHVLANTSMDNQAVQLNALRDSKQLTPFIQKAMAGPQEHPTLWSAVESVQRWSPVTFERFARVDGLLLNASVVDVRDSWDRGLPISRSDLAKLRTELFNVAAFALTDGRIESNFKDNSMFKDALASIFMSEFDSIINSGLGANGASFDIVRFQPGLEKFFQHVLFTPNPSYTSKALSNFLADKMTRIGQALTDSSPGAEQRFRDQFHRSRMDGAAIAGGLLGMLTNAIKESNDALRKDAEAKAEAVKFVVGLALGFIPGIGKKLSDGAESAIAKILLEKTLGPIQDKVMDLIKDGATEQAKRLILDQYKNKDPQIAVIGLFNALNQIIPNGDKPGEQNFLTQFQSSYNTAINSPTRIAR